MSTHVGELLDDARRRRFVGRRREVAGFGEALGGRSPRRVLFVHGEGGIGKTTLLQEFRALARAAGRHVVQVDGRDVDPSPEGLATALRRAALPHGADGPIPELLTGAVLLVDGYEQLHPIDGWLRDEFLPSLNADSIVVLAGREPPRARWRSDPGWRHLLAVHRLGPFDQVEGHELLALADVAAPLREHLVTLGRGHPLTMALLADLAASGQVPDTLAAAPDLISTLVESFLDGTPGEAYRTGLATCAIAWLTTEDLLRALVGAEAAAVWQWLARRPFVTTGQGGLFTHDLARDVLLAEFERRSPDRYRACRAAVHAHAVAGLRAATGVARQPHAQLMNFMLRGSPIAQAISTLRAQGSAAVVPARTGDHEQVCAIIERFEGPASARLARAWLTEQPGQLSVVRGRDGVTGFAHHLICPTGSVLETQDPVVRAVLDCIARHGPIRPGERVDIVRFVGGAGEHQRDLHAVLVGNVSSIIEWATRPLAWSFAVFVDDEYWAPFFDFMAFAQLVEVDVGGLRHVAYGLDWRRLPVDVWFELVHERGHSGQTGPPPPELVRPLPLDRDSFAAAVRAALQTLHQPDRFGANPLLGSALAATAAGPDAARLRAVIVDAVACLGEEAKGRQLRAVLHRTYVRAAPTQEAAAEVLGLPLSTYRRHLARALDRLTELLWTAEIGETPIPARQHGS